MRHLRRIHFSICVCMWSIDYICLNIPSERVIERADEEREKEGMVKY